MCAIRLLPQSRLLWLAFITLSLIQCSTPAQGPRQGYLKIDVLDVSSPDGVMNAFLKKMMMESLSEGMAAEIQFNRSKLVTFTRNDEGRVIMREVFDKNTKLVHHFATIDEVAYASVDSAFHNFFAMGDLAGVDSLKQMFTLHKGRGSRKMVKGFECRKLTANITGDDEPEWTMYMSEHIPFYPAADERLGQYFIGYPLEMHMDVNGNDVTIGVKSFTDKVNENAFSTSTARRTLIPQAELLERVKDVK